MSDLNNILTVTEAAELWCKDVGNLRKEFIKGLKFELGKDIRKSGSTWLVTKESMKKNFGDIQNK